MQQTVLKIARDIGVPKVTSHTDIQCKDCNIEYIEEMSVAFRMEYDFPLCDRCYFDRMVAIEMQERKSNPEKFLVGTGIEQAEIKFSFENYTKQFEDLNYLKKYAYQKTLNDLIISGACGAGKTHLAIAIMRELIIRGCTPSKMHYYVESALHRKLVQVARSNSDFEYYFDKVCNYEFMVLDDLCRKKPSETCISYTVDIIDERQRRNKKTLITLNKLLKMNEVGDGSIQDVYGDPLYDRLKMFKYVPVKLDSYRDKIKR
jgi:DNA replication protein DnaC